MVFKSEVIVIANKKMGRPTDNPKHIQIAVRFDTDTLNILDDFCQKANVSRAEGVRLAVRKLEEDK